MTRLARPRFPAAAAAVLTGMALACGPRATATSPVAATSSKPVVVARRAVAPECKVAERAVEGWLASGRYGRALVALRALRAASCPGADRLSSALDEKRKVLGLSAALPAPALRRQLSGVRALRAAGRAEEAQSAVDRLLAANPGRAFVLAEAGLVARSRGQMQAAEPYFEQALLAFGAPELEPAAERFVDFHRLTFGADNSELWSCLARGRVTDANTLEPLFRFPLAGGCHGLDIAEGGVATSTTASSLDPTTFSETPYPENLRAVRLVDRLLLFVQDRAGSDQLSFGVRAPSGEAVGPLLSLPGAGGAEVAITSDPDGQWTVVSTVDSAWAFDRSTRRAPLALGGPAVAVRDKKAVVNLGDRGALVELPSKHRIRSVPLEGCPASLPPSADISWAAVSRDASTVALLRCSSITVWRWGGVTAQPLATDPGELRMGGGDVEPFALSGDGGLVVRAPPGTLELFDTGTGQLLRRMESPSSHTLTVSAAPSGALALMTSERRVFVVSESGKLEGEVPVRGDCRAAKWYDDDSLLLTCGSHLIRASRAGGRILSKVKLKLPLEGAFAVSPGHAVAAHGERSQLVALESGKIERELSGRVAWVSPDGKLAVSTKLASDGSSTLGVVSLATGATLASAADDFRLAAVDPVTGALLVLGTNLWYFAPREPHPKRLAERQALRSAPGAWPKVLRFSTDRRNAVVGFDDGSSRVWELSTGRASPGPSDAVRGLVWYGDRGYRRSDGKQVVTIEPAPSGEAFSVVTAPGAIEFLGAEPADLPICSFGVAQFPFELCRDAVTVPGLLRQWMTNGEWYGG